MTMMNILERKGRLRNVTVAELSYTRPYMAEIECLRRCYGFCGPGVRWVDLFASAVDRENAEFAPLRIGQRCLSNPSALDSLERQ